MREELTGEWRGLHNELHCVFSLQTIWMIKSEVMSWACVSQWRGWLCI